MQDWVALACLIWIACAGAHYGFQCGYQACRREHGIGSVPNTAGGEPYIVNCKIHGGDGKGIRLIRG